MNIFEQTFNEMNTTALIACNEGEIAELELKKVKAGRKIMELLTQLRLASNELDHIYSQIQSSQKSLKYNKLQQLQKNISIEK